ncbi:Uncharacterised protein [BD1-7 clade bacterium]|uniref:Lipoprotein n=1 Tax=BD1-7 clade bacterium TaxID=2029982 RepID=A0A5S9Q500_9GAMM|nr:Uncharacterised protein [BD1-7 clade bacterium]CAA0112090.1 Uncharacterised protein [BD1-7 clade bacterium]
MRLLIVGLFVAVMLSGCGGGSSSSGSDSPDSNNTGGAGGGGGNKQISIPDSAVKPGSQGANVPVSINDLGSDDPIYFSVVGAAVESGDVEVTPSSAVLLPTDGEAALLLKVAERGLTDVVDVTVEFSTADNKVVKATFEVAPN